MRDVHRSRSADRTALVALLIFAALLRGLVLWKYGGQLAEDRDQYRAIAQEILAGRGFSNPQTHLPTAYRPPLYPLLVAGVLGLGGGNLAIGVAQVVLGVATVGLTYLAGKRLGQGQASFIAGLVVAVDPLLLYQTVLVMTEAAAAFLAALVLWLCSERRGGLRNFGLGVAFGFCCLCRPTFWAFGAFGAAVWCLQCWRRRSRSDLPSSLTGERTGSCAVDWRTALSTLAGFALVISPWCTRNVLVMRQPIMTTTHGGYTLLLAHNPAYTRAVVEQPWGALFEGSAFDEWSAGIEAEMAQEDPPIDVSQVSPTVELARDRWMNARAWRYIREDPGAAFRAGLTLLGRFWNVTPLATERTPVSAVLRVAIGAFYVIVTLAALVGLWRLSRADWLQWWPPAALIVSFTLVHALYWADMRMRTPLIPAIALLASVCAGARGKKGGQL